MSKNWVERIKNPPSDSTFGNLFLYYSPGLDNRIFQEELKPKEYAEWVMSYTSDSYSPDFISPFSANESQLRISKIPSSAVLSDITTMWELETLKTLKKSKTWKDLQ